MGAYLAFTAEAMRKHVDYCHIDPVRYGHADRVADFDRVRHFTGTWNMTRPARLDERTRKAISMSAGGRN